MRPMSSLKGDCCCPSSPRDLYERVGSVIYIFLIFFDPFFKVEQRAVVVANAARRIEAALADRQARNALRQSESKPQLFSTDSQFYQFF